MGKATESKKAICPRLMENGENCGKEGRVGIRRINNKVYYVITHHDVKTGHENVHYVNTPAGIQTVSEVYGPIRAPIHRKSRLKDCPRCQKLGLPTKNKHRAYFKHDNPYRRCWFTQQEFDIIMGKSSPEPQNKYSLDFDWAKKELGKVVKRKAWVIKTLAAKLENEGMEPSLICSAIVAAKLPDIHESYPRHILPEKYKRSHVDQSTVETVKLPNITVSGSTYTQPLEQNKLEDYSEDLDKLDKEQLKELVKEQRADLEELDVMNKRQTSIIQENGQAKEFWYSHTLTINNGAIEYAKAHGMELPVKIHVDPIHSKAWVFLDKIVTTTAVEEAVLA